MQRYRLNIVVITIALWGLLGLLSCSSEQVDKGASQEPQTQSVAITASSGTASSRVSIDSSDMQSVVWSDDDQLALWALDESSGNFAFSASTFSLHYYGSVYSSAIFTGQISAMEEGSYTYCATYPLPKSTSGSQATFNIPSTQSGYYDGAASLMVAKSSGAAALCDDNLKNVELAFSHLTHAIRIEIPEDRDLLGSTSKLQIIFPQDVVGDVSFDITSDNPELSLSNGSNSVYVDFDQVISEAGYVWLFIAPTTIDGEIEFVGYDVDNVPSQSISTTLSNREMSAGHITPITLTIPEESYRNIVVTIGENYLGESINSLTFTAPSGGYFEGGVSSVTVTANSDGEFVASYSPARYDSIFRSGDITLSFDSDNATSIATPISLSEEDKYQNNYFSRDIPYLFEEYFDGISETGSYNLLTGQDLPGLTSYWTSGRIYNYWAGNCIAIKCYYSANVETNGYLNLELDGKTSLKEGKSVTLKIAFDGGWKANYCSSMKLTITNENDKSGSVSFTSNSNASQSNKPDQKSTTVSSCTSDDVLQFKSNGTADSFWKTDYDYIYIDNIKISIN